MIQTQETLYIVLSVAIVCVTVFLCWALYELATFLRRSNRIVDEVERKVQHVQESLSNIKDRFEQVAGYASMLLEGGKTVASFLHRDKEEETESKTKSKRGKKGGLFDEEG
jgi:biopolymer transport protein ExbB/TolQ